MNKSLKRFLLMFAVLCVFVCGLVFAVACGDNGDTTGTTGGEPEQKVTYSVSVTTDTDLDLTTVKAQWKSGSQAVGDAIALNAEGKASVELESGDYTVDLVGVDADKYVYQPANVTATAPDATITITAKPPVSTSHNVIISVAVPAGITLPADAGVQLYKDGTAEGTPVTIANNTAMVTVPNGTGYTVGLVNMPDYLGWGTAQAVADSTTTLTFTIAYADVEYTVTVEKGNYADALTGVKVELWAAEATEATASADLTDGSATVTATAGTYTVKLNGLAADYGYAEGQVTIAQRSATITITGNEVEVTLVKNVSASAVNFADLTVNFKSGDDVAYSVKPNSDGVAVFAVPAGEYTVEVSGLPAGYASNPASVVAETTEVEIEICAAPERYVFPVTSEDETMPLPNSYTIVMGKNINMYVESKENSGDSISYEMLYLKFVAPADALYTFTTGEDITIFGGLILSDPLPDATEVMQTQPTEPYASTENSMTYMLDEGDNLWVVVGNHTEVKEAGEKIYFDLTVTSAEIPVLGTIANPIVETDFEGEHKLPEDSDRTSAYFKIPAIEGSFVPAMEEGVELYYFGDQPTETILPEHKLENGVRREIGDDITGEYVYFLAKLADNAAEDTVLQFTLEEYIEQGSYPVNPFELPYNEETSYQFPMGQDIPPVWYSFTAPKTGDYRMSETHGNVDFAPTVYGSYVGKGSDSLGNENDIVTPNAANGSYHLEAEKTYYILIPAINGTVIYIKIEDYVAQLGEAGNPIEAPETGETPNTVEIKFGENVYFKHTVKAESLNADGDFVLEFDPHPSSMTAVFYKEATYSGDTYGTLGYDNGQFSITISDLQVDDVVYFYINASETSATFYINRPAAEVEEMEVGKTVTHTHVDGGGDAMSVTFGISSVQPGKYVVQYSVDKDPQITKGQIFADISGRTYASKIRYDNDSDPNPDGSHNRLPLATNGKIEIEIQEGDKNITLRTDGGTPDTYVWSFTLKEYKPELTLEDSLVVDISGSSATVALGVPAGNYSLAYDFGMSVFSAMIAVNVGGKEYTISTPFNGGQTGTVDIEVAEGVEEMSLTINNNGEATSLTLSLTALTPVEPEEDELTLGEPLSVQLTPENYVIDKHIALGADITAGEYTLTIVASGLDADTWPFNMSAWTFKFGDNSFNTATGNMTMTATLNVTIPEACTELVIHKESIGMSPIFTLTLTTAGSGPVVPPAPQYDITVGESAEVTMPANYLGENKTVYLEVGTYTITVTGDDLNSVSIEDGSWKLGDFGSIMAAGSARTATITVAEAGKYTLTFKDTIGNGKTVSVLITAGGSTGPVGPTTYDMKVGESASVTVDEDGTKKTIYLEVGKYTMTLGGQYNEVYTQIQESEGISYTPDNADYNWLQEKTEKVSFEVTKAGVFTFTFGDATWGPGGQQITVLIELDGGSAEIGEITVGEDTEVVIPAGYDGANKTVYLEAGTYTVTVTGDSGNVVAIGEDTSTLGDHGTILNPDGERVATFTVETAGQYTLNFQDTTGAGITINVLIEVSGEEAEEPDFTLGEEGTVTFTGTSDPEEVVKTIQLEEGSYTITIVGDMANAMVLDSNETTVVSRTQNSGELQIEVTGLVELTFRHFGTTPLTLTVTITAQ